MRLSCLSGSAALLAMLALPHLPAQTPSPTSSGISPLTLAQALDLARARNPTLLAAQQHLAATRTSEITAALRQNPTVAFLGQDVTLPANNPGNPYFYSGNLSRLFERGQKRRWRMESAQATTSVTDSQYRDQERQTLLNVKTAFTNMLLAKATRDVADESLKGYRRTVDLSRERLKAGESALPISSGLTFNWPNLKATRTARDSTCCKRAINYRLISELLVRIELST